MKKLSFLFILLISISFISAIPNDMTVHIKISEDFETPVNYNISLNFTIYDEYTDGLILWNDAFYVKPIKGIATVTLKDINLNFSDNYYLGVKIGNDNEATPRTNLTSNPYAFRSNNTDYFQDYTPTTLKDWIQNAFNSVYCELIGCEMQGDINMGNNDILNAGNINISNNLTISSEGFTKFLSGINYFREDGLNGTWRIFSNDTNDMLELSRFENGEYIIKASFGDSITTDRMILDGINPEIVTIANNSQARVNYKNLIREAQFGEGTVVGNLLESTYLDTSDEVYIQKKSTPIFSVEVQNISNVTIETTNFSYNTTTPTTGVGYPFDGGQNFIQRYNISGTNPVRTYTRISEQGNGGVIIWESSSYYDFTQNKGKEVFYNSTLGLYEEVFDIGVTLLSGTTYFIETFINQSVNVRGTYINDEFVPYLRPTGIGYIKYTVATYEFLDNNFIGTGNFTTTGNISLGKKIVFGLGEMIDNIIDGWLKITGNLNVTKSIQIGENLNVVGNITANYINAKSQIAQFHRDADVVTGSIDTWYNITWDLEIENESTNGWYNLIDSNETIQIDGFNGIIRVQGCVHPYNNNIITQEAKMYIRVLINGVEARCLQSSRTKSFKSSGIDIINYAGTVHANDGDNIQIQWRVNNINIELRGDTTFDNPVSASVNFEKISDLP